MTAGRLRRAVLAAALLVSAQVMAWAQPAPVPSLVRRDRPDAVTARASRTTPLTLDGRLDEAIYTTVAPLTDFLQHAARVLRPGGRLVWISPLPRVTHSVALQAGLRCQHTRTVDMGGFSGQLELWVRSQR